MNAVDRIKAEVMSESAANWAMRDALRSTDNWLGHWLTDQAAGLLPTRDSLMDLQDHVRRALRRAS